MLNYLVYFLTCFALPLAADTLALEKYVSTQDATLFCQVMGKGKPLIILHGGAGFLTHDHLVPHLASLQENHCLVFYDQRGLGRSSGSTTPEQINLKTYIEDIEAIRLSLGAEKISILGHSWGAFLGMHYAMEHSSTIDKLILVGSMPGSSVDLFLFFGELMNRLEPIQDKYNKIESSDLYLAGDPETVEASQRLCFQTYMYKQENIAKLNLWKPKNACLNSFKVWEIFKENIFMKPFSLFENLAKIKCPTLLLHGAQDVIPYETAERLQQAIPSSKIIKIEQCGHFPFLEQPEVFLRETNAFLKE